MQCSPLLCGTGYPNLSQFCYNHQFSDHTICPEIIGEGEVVSVFFPDGSIHLYFIPLNKRSSYQPTYQPNPNYNIHFNNNMGAYYVRSISNPISYALFNQQCQQIYGGHFPRPSYISNCNQNIPPPGFQLKFHNDCWTSTTDLHYFSPRFRRCEWYPETEVNGSASIQVDIPVKEKTFCNQEVECARPNSICSISDDEGWSDNNTVECYCNKAENTQLSKRVTNKNQNVLNRDTRENKKKTKNKRSSNVVCECINTTDKCITTYAEQATCAAENERNTQTCRSCTAATSKGANSVASRSNISTELWFPRLVHDKQALHSRSSEKVVGLYETTCSSTTCCCSTDAETRDA